MILRVIREGIGRVSRMAVGFSWGLVILGLNPIWDGTLLGRDTFFEGIELWDGGLFDLLRLGASDLNMPSDAILRDDEFLIVHLSIVVVAAFFGFLLNKAIEKIATGSSETTEKIRNFYSIGDLLRKLVFSTLGSLELFDRVVLRKIWEGSHVGHVGAWLKKSTEEIGRLDEGLKTGLSTTMGRVFLSHSKALQVLQNGNLQWYIFLTVSLSIGILIHFLQG